MIYIISHIDLQLNHATRSAQVDNFLTLLTVFLKGLEE